MDAKIKRFLTAAVLLLVVIGVERVTGVDVLEWLEDGSSAQPVAEVQTSLPEVDPSTARVVTWNLYNFGQSKNDGEIAFIAETLRDADVVAVQEVSTGPAGAQAVGRLDRELDRKGFAWDYRVSDPTTGDGSERYAFLWKPSRLRLIGTPWLEESLASTIDREPFCARFEHRETGQTFLVTSIHAVPTSKDPEHEIARLDRLHRAYEDDHLVVLGDFNLDEDHEAFDALRNLGYVHVLDDQKTSLRRKRQSGPSGHLSEEYDNIFVESAPLQPVRTGVVDFTRSFSSLKQARDISDHLPVYVDLSWSTPARSAAVQPAP
jgi:endonuclease/exonuclease/phosphatase family metal-dependent hydrolase